MLNGKKPSRIDKLEALKSLKRSKGVMRYKLLSLTGLALLVWIVCVLFLLSRHLNISEDGADITKKDIKISSGHERRIHDYYEEHKKEIDFWIYDVFHLNDEQTFLLNVNNFKKIQYKVEREKEGGQERAYVYFLNLKKEPEELTKYEIHKEDFFFQELKTTTPSVWKVFFPKDQWVKDELRRFFRKKRINDIRTESLFLQVRIRIEKNFRLQRPRRLIRFQRKKINTTAIHNQANRSPILE